LYRFVAPTSILFDCLCSAFSVLFIIFGIYVFLFTAKMASTTSDAFTALN
jgi:hypothetical protein